MVSCQAWPFLAIIVGCIGRSTLLFDLATRADMFHIASGQRLPSQEPNEIVRNGSSKAPMIVRNGMRLEIRNDLGVIKATCELSSHHDPRILQSTNRFMIYDRGEWPMLNLSYVRMHPQDMDMWMSETRAWVVFDFHSLKRSHLFWEADDGIPILLGADSVCSLRVNNLTKCLQHIIDNNELPQLDFEWRSVSSGGVTRRVRLLIDDEDAWKLVKDFCGIAPVGTVTLDLQPTGRLKFSAFGHSVYGKWFDIAKRREPVYF